MTDLVLLAQEIARAALNDPQMRDRIGNDLDLSDYYLQTVSKELNYLLDKETNGGDHAA